LKNAIFFISYHAGSLVEYDSLREIDDGKSLHVAVMCRHPYMAEEMISAYSKGFEHVIVLPDIRYETNVVKGLMHYRRFKEIFNNEINPILKGIDSFCIVSDCSAYLPVNALISAFKKNKKCKNLISIREDLSVDRQVCLLSTIRTLFYTTLLGLYRVFTYKVLMHLYVKEPRDIVVKLVSPFRRSELEKKSCSDGVPIHYIYSPLSEKRSSKKSVVVFYSNRNLEVFITDLSREKHSNKIRKFLRKLSVHYKDSTIVCIPHPLDKGNVIDEMQEIDFELCNDNLTSQMHIKSNPDIITACYSISSTSLIYAASVGIPSYTIFKYLEYNNELPKAFFMDDHLMQVPFLYHIRKVEEIGEIDNIFIEPIENSSTEDWEKILYSGDM